MWPSRCAGTNDLSTRTHFFVMHPSLERPDRQQDNVEACG